MCVSAQKLIVMLEHLEQKLEPLGGKIDRPESWQYSEQHTPQSWNWIIAEHLEISGIYEVGVRIQASYELMKLTGQSAKQIVSSYKERKSKEADRVLNECPAKEQGLFTRVCIETEEGKYRILYSMFWGTNSDILVITTMGAPREIYDNYQSVFDRMQLFELIDMSRFTKQDEANKAN